ncbi:MAG: ATP-binding cassette domain-containing protein [Calditrichaeota bacterium]|nr:MAG: ATP-binding cassette domain-containing protein [Calditrichota bacterium]RPI03832.1 MAG: ATP-binding cassette domain-containing protein [Calditrichota bacterium]
MIQVDHIYFRYHSEDNSPINILNDVSLEIRAGERIAIMGRNGSGKTTFARCLNGLLLPSSGVVRVDGLTTSEAKNLADIRRHVGMVFQNPDNQIVSATVEREVAFGLENLGVPFEEMHEIVERMLFIFNLEKLRKQPPHQLSGGEKQRLALASVMAMHPKYLVLDEPTSLLDPKSRREVLERISTLPQDTENPVATLLITQFPEEALYANRLIVFHQGKIIMDDAPDELFSRHKELEAYGLEVPVKFQIAEFIIKYLQS